jgi:hypothetical protein
MAHNVRYTMGWRTRGGVLAAVGVALAGASLTASAADAPSMGAARDFAVLGASTVESTGFTVVNGDVGVSPGTEIVGFPPGIVNGGSLHSADPAANAAHADAQLAYDFLAGMASLPANNLSDTDLGGLTLAPGVYKFNSSAGLTGALVLDAGGSSNALFVFQIGSSLTTATDSSVTVINSGGNYDESQLYWQVGSSATLGSNTAFKGNILAYASITLVTGATNTGNLLALNGAVTLDSNTVTSPPGGSGGGGGTGQPGKGRTILDIPVGALDLDASARIEVKHFPARGAREERSWFRAKMNHLDKTTEYTLWANDPATPETDLVQFGTFTTNGSGKFYLKLDTKKGDEMPFDATLAALAGQAIEIRDSAGTTTILAGTIPAAVTNQ